MEEKNSFSRLSLLSPGIPQHTQNLSDSSSHRLSKFRFYKAFVSLERAEGVSKLSLIWQSESHKKSLEVHNYLLRFNHEGIKEYWIEDITYLGELGWRNRLVYNTVQIGLPEAASLIQDAHRQNKRFKTKVAQDIDDSHILLEYDTTGVERFKLNQQLLPRRLDVMMFTNIYLAALKRLDRSLLYDLAGQERQRQLGDRSEYLEDIEDELSQSTFLRTGINSVQAEGKLYLVNAHVVLSTPKEEICRIYYRIQILVEDGAYCVLDFTEYQKEFLSATHSENPLNYQVFASLYQHNAKEKVQQWLAKQPCVFLGGELPYREMYKWLNGGSEPWEDFDFSQAISVEFILTDQELLIFSQKPEVLAGVSRLLSVDLPCLLVNQDQYHLENYNLFQILFDEENWAKTSSLASHLQAKRAQSFILLLEPQDEEEFAAYLAIITTKIVRMGQNTTYYLLKKGKLLAELYSAGRWLKLNIYRGSWEEELAFLMSNFRFVDIIKDYELGNNFDLFTPPLLEQRKWVIFRQLLIMSKEARIIKDMGLVPSVREAVRKLGVVV